MSIIVRPGKECGGFELERREIVEMNVADIGRAHDAEVLQFELLLQMDGDQILQHLLPDVAGKLLADEVGGREVQGLPT